MMAQNFANRTNSDKCCGKGSNCAQDHGQNGKNHDPKHHRTPLSQRREALLCLRVVGISRVGSSATNPAVTSTPYHRLLRLYDEGLADLVPRCLILVIGEEEDKADDGDDQEQQPTKNGDHANEDEADVEEHPPQPGVEVCG